MPSGDFIGIGLTFGDLMVSDEFEEKSELDETFDCADSFESGSSDSRGGKVWLENGFVCDDRL